MNNSKKKFFATLTLASVLAFGAALFVSQSVDSKQVKQAKATTDVGEISVSEVRNAISTDSAMYLLPTKNYDLPDSWDYAYTAVGEEDGIFINGVKYAAGSLKYAGTGSAYITFYLGLPAAAVEGDVVEFKGAFACAAADRSFTMNFAAQRFASTWILAIEAYDTVSLKDANLPDISGTAINTDDMGLNASYTTDAAGLPSRNGYFGLTNETGSYAFQFNYKKTTTGTGWFHVLIGGQGPLWRTGHFIDFGFLDAWDPVGTGHAQIKEMRGNGNNWAADELHATGAIALGWEVGQTNLLEMGKIKVKGSSQHFIFFKVNGALKFGEYWTLAEGGMTTKVTLQYANTDATVTNSIEPASTKLSPATYVPATKYFYMDMENDICPGVSNWSDYFKSVDSNGLKLNGENVGVDNWNFFKKTGSKQMFLALGDIGITPASGDILYVGGMFKAAREVNGVKVLFKANFSDSYFQYNGEKWVEITAEQAAAAAELAAAKVTAKAELEAYVDSNDYREAEQGQLATIIADGKEAIDDAANLEDMNDALDDAKAEIDLLKTAAEHEAEEAAALADAKTAAKAELDDWKTAHFNEYREAQQTTITNSIASAKEEIDAATSIDDVDTLLANVKDELNNLPTDAQLTLQEAKASAKAQLDTYNSDDYREAEQGQLATIIADGKEAIDAAASVADVNSALADAKALADALKTKAAYEAAELEAAKTAAKTELEGYKKASDYREAEAAQLAAIVSEGKDAIDAATSIDGVNTALASAKTKADSLKTAAQYETEEAALEAKRARAIKAISDYYDLLAEQNKYTEENAAALLKAKNDCIAAINAATTVDALNAAVTAGQAALDAVEKIQPDSEPQVEPKPEKKGCGGSVIAASTLISTLALAGFGLLISKKRK